MSENDKSIWDHVVDFLKDALKDTIGQAIATLILAILASGGLVWFWSYVSSFFIWFYSEISDPVILPEYAPYLSYLIGVLSVIVFYLLRKKFLLTHKNYRKDEFFGITWKWKYSGYSKDVLEHTIIPICSKCSSELDEFGSQDLTYFLCFEEGCEEGLIELKSSPDRIRERVAKKIDRNLREWNLKL